MSKRSTLARVNPYMLGTLTLLCLSFSIAGCGGGGGTATALTPPPAANPSPPAQTIEGIATPSSVAVVTATNAQ